MKLKILLMLPNKPSETREVTFRAATPTYEELKAVVKPLLDGQDLECVRVLASLDNNPPYQVLHMFVGESSALDGLPRNEAATTHYRRATMLGLAPAPTPSDPEEIPAIYGPAVLFEKPVWF
jgi:hypothetical protein